MKKQQTNNNNNKSVNNKSNSGNVNNNNNNDVNKKVEEMYLEKEELREDIIIDKRKILDLDQRNNLNIEALDNIVNIKSENKNKNGKLWIYTGDIFIQMKENNAKELIIKENDAIESEIESLQSGLVEKQQNLKKLEMDYQLERNKLFT
ncbi:hypothetical protein DDB_G0267576 [Dictyostelium discoideum AX4]|uniref:Uncharacterized protein n=1 Tax=Dictyostelium discoideum TaxID=44689 RepID=Q55GP2_DICDI|nr:hypothetical protein DDB_G0267576 [Dictyostelium discoideum AX4]EAL73241.1 hypothetical protein DDB_G0267576 [Dictyostelium discoideum AX4]|eukprot:XP_647142.1 hypothetical protein DDB_G0267576 [Dictyostelium discoideum AX4]